MKQDMYMMARPKSKFPKMSMSDRASQFAPFAALTGHKEGVLEQERITQQKRVLSNERKLELNQQIMLAIQNKSKCKVTYFEKDKTKSGGSYVSRVLTFKSWDEILKKVIFKEGIKIQIDCIVDIENLEH